jgi:hypothetical protein
MGGFVTWLFVLYFSKVVSTSFVSPVEKIQTQSAETDSSESVMAAEESEKGQSVDFVFPELSPDK